MGKIFIAPSLLAADKNQLGLEVAKAVSAGADYLHFDIMDGHFVPNISFGLSTVRSFSKTHPLVNDVHIMIEKPLKYAASYVKAGADIVTFHYEACRSDDERNQVIASILAVQGKPGMSIKPKTDVNVLIPFLKDLHLVLVMSVEPGLGGQMFMPSAIEKISYLRTYIVSNHLSTLIEVDGGINAETGPLCLKAGADILVAGSYLFGHDDMQKRMALLKRK